MSLEPALRAKLATLVADLAGVRRLAKEVGVEVRVLRRAAAGRRIQRRLRERIENVLEGKETNHG
ncbi:MAG: hypothetical protein IT477_10585 [Rhodanobacteraceae bacterium]|nr:hypothetical protein [Rhodanobacteraceae bacterium]